MPSKTRENLLTLLCVRFPWSFHPLLPALAEQAGTGAHVCVVGRLLPNISALSKSMTCSWRRTLVLLQDSTMQKTKMQLENKNIDGQRACTTVLGESMWSQTSLIAIERRDEVCSSWIAVGNKMRRFSDGYIPYSKNKYLFGKMCWDQAKHSSVAAQNERTCSQTLFFCLWKFISWQRAGLDSKFTKKRTFVTSGVCYSKYPKSQSICQQFCETLPWEGLLKRTCL